MSRSRTFLGLAAGTLMLLSAPLHAFLGWKAMAAAFKAAGTPPDLVQAAHLNWVLSGAAILVFGLLTLWTFWKGRRAEGPSRLPTLLIGLAYTIFGAWALAVAKDVFFLVFLVPGLMLLIASATRASLAPRG